MLPAIGVELVEATTSDMELVLAWRNNPDIYKGFYKQSKGEGPIPWERHLSWWFSRYNWKTFMIVASLEVTEPICPPPGGNGSRKVGFIQIGQLDCWKPQIGYAIGETTLWGKGVCKEAVRQALDWLREKGYIRVWTSVLKDNIGSYRVLEGLNFRKVGNAREGEWEYELNL